MLRLSRVVLACAVAVVLGVPAAAAASPDDAGVAHGFRNVVLAGGFERPVIGDQLVRPVRAQRLIHRSAVAFGSVDRVGVVPSAEPTGAAGAPWNIVLIKTDDEGYVGDLVSRSMPLRHELFDLHGLTFTHYRSSTPLCCPDRASTLTGLWEHHHGVIGNGPSLDPRETIATKLRARGWKTGLFGKYLNGCNLPCATVQAGWDRWLVPTALQSYGPTLKYYSSDKGAGSAAPATAIPGYTTDTIMETAAAWIRSVPADTPFFAYVTPIAPHEPTIPPSRFAASAACPTTWWKPPSYNEADVSDKPAWIRSKPLQRSRSGFDLQQTCRTLLAVDDGLAQILNAVGPERRAHTLFIYSGDNGMNYGEHRLISKQTPYATRVPFQIYAPALTGPGPRTVDEEVQNVDVAPTLCALTGCTLGPYPRGQQHPDGLSMLPLITGAATSLHRDANLEENTNGKGYPGEPPWWAVRTFAGFPYGQWHFVRYEGGTCELFDQVADPWELSNLMLPDSCELRPQNSGLRATVTALGNRLDALLGG